jgi:hypothetical protein
MSRADRVVAAGLAIVVLAGLLALVFGPARGARADIATQKKLITSQLAVMRTQLDLQRQQLQLAQQQLALAKQTRDLASQTRDIAAQTLVVARSTKGDVDLQLTISRALLALSRELATIARQTLKHAANIDRKTGPTRPVALRSVAMG